MKLKPKKKATLARKDIREKVAACKVLTPKQKLEMLKKTRALLDTNYADGWMKFIDGVEHYCLYGAMQKIAGLEPGSGNDDLISSCSLTSTLYNSIPSNLRASTDKAISRMVSKAKDPYDRLYNKRNIESSIMYEKVVALQMLNDDSKDDIIKVVDKAIKKLEKQIAKK